MYISKVTIKNYRNFKDFQIELKPFTLIVGENNTGKTNLLNAIGLVFSQEITSFKNRVLEIDDFNYDVVQAFKRSVASKSIPVAEVKFPEVVVEVDITGMNEDQEAVVGDWFCDKELKQAKITYLFHPNVGFKKGEWIEKQRSNITTEETSVVFKAVDFPIDKYEYLIYGGGDQSNRSDAYFLRMLKMEVLDALRDAKKELVASGDYRLLFRVLNRKDLLEYKEIKDLLDTLEDAIRRNQALKAIRKEIEDLLLKISLQGKNEINRIDFSFTTPETTEILKKLGLIYGTDPISVDRNGLGRNNLLYISLILSQLSTGQQRSDTTFFRLIGIEEPEAHLHPQLQDHLARNIKSLTQNRDDIQLILTSHSTHIVGCLDLNSSVIIYKTEAGETCNHYVLSGMGDTSAEKQTIRYLEKYLDATKSTMFFARRIILVEGISEQILIPKLFHIYTGGNLESIGCTIINVNGVAFRHFLEIVKNGYFIRCVILTDKDEGKPTELRAENLRSSYLNFPMISIQINSDTFEKEIIRSNQDSDGRTLMLSALKKTRPLIGKSVEQKYLEKEIDVDEYFKAIEDYKSDFASDLLEVLNEGHQGFSIPDYIKSGFDFINS